MAIHGPLRAATQHFTSPPQLGTNVSLSDYKGRCADPSCTSIPRTITVVCSAEASRFQTASGSSRTQVPRSSASAPYSEDPIAGSRAASFAVRSPERSRWHSPCPLPRAQDVGPHPGRTTFLIDKKGLSSMCFRRNSNLPNTIRARSPRRKTARKPDRRPRPTSTGRRPRSSATVAR